MSGTQALLAFAVVAFFAIASMYAIGVTSRDNQVALTLKPVSCAGAKNKDCPAEIPKVWTYTCAFPGVDPNPGNKPAKCARGKQCSEPGGKSGKTVKGTCQCPNICKGNPDEATGKNDPGKMPELPKPPEKKPPPPGGPPPPEKPCTPGSGGNSSGREGCPSAAGGAPASTLGQSFLKETSFPDTQLSDAPLSDEESTPTQSAFSKISEWLGFSDSRQSTEAVEGSADLFGSSDPTGGGNSADLSSQSGLSATQRESDSFQDAGGNSTFAQNTFSSPDLNPSVSPAQTSGFWGGIQSTVSSIQQTLRNLILSFQSP